MLGRLVMLWWQSGGEGSKLLNCSTQSPLCPTVPSETGMMGPCQRSLDEARSSVCGGDAVGWSLTGEGDARPGGGSSSGPSHSASRNG